MDGVRLPDPEPAFFYREGGPASRLLLLVDHAHNRVPPGYGTLGLAEAQFTRHIAYDPGSFWLAERLAVRWGAHLLSTNFTRLFIDPNRGEADPTLIMRLSDGAVIPGNREVDHAEREYRLGEYHRPYHQKIEAVLNQIVSRGEVPLILSFHSFTPEWKGKARPWHFGLLHEQDLRLTEICFKALEIAWPEAAIGLNEPYSAGLTGDTLARHGTAKGFPHGLLEVRNDLVQERSQAEELADRMAESLEPGLEDPSLKMLWSDFCRRAEVKD